MLLRTETFLENLPSDRTDIELPHCKLDKVDRFITEPKCPMPTRDMPEDIRTRLLTDIVLPHAKKLSTEDFEENRPSPRIETLDPNVRQLQSEKLLTPCLPSNTFPRTEIVLPNSRASHTEILLSNPVVLTLIEAPSFRQSTMESLAPNFLLPNDLVLKVLPNSSRSRTESFLDIEVRPRIDIEDPRSTWRTIEVLRRDPTATQPSRDIPEDTLTNVLRESDEARFTKFKTEAELENRAQLLTESVDPNEKYCITVAPPEILAFDARRETDDPRQSVLNKDILEPIVTRFLMLSELPIAIA